MLLSNITLFRLKESKIITSILYSLPKTDLKKKKKRTIFRNNFIEFPFNNIPLFLEDNKPLHNRFHIATKQSCYLKNKRATPPLCPALNASSIPSATYRARIVVPRGGTTTTTTSNLYPFAIKAKTSRATTRRQVNKAGRKEEEGERGQRTPGQKSFPFEGQISSVIKQMLVI